MVLIWRHTQKEILQALLILFLSTVLLHHFLPDAVFPPDWKSQCYCLYLCVRICLIHTQVVMGEQHHKTQKREVVPILCLNAENSWKVCL